MISRQQALSHPSPPGLQSEQILAEYRAKALACHPDKRPNDEGAEKRFQRLQEAKEVLLDAEKRKLYDTWRGAGVWMPFKRWLALSTQRGPNGGHSLHTSMHWI